MIWAYMWSVASVSCQASRGSAGQRLGEEVDMVEIVAERVNKWRSEKVNRQVCVRPGGAESVAVSVQNGGFSDVWVSITSLFSSDAKKRNG